MNFRFANTADIPHLLELYAASKPVDFSDPYLENPGRFQEALASQRLLAWLGVENSTDLGSKIRILVLILHEQENRLLKVHKIFLDSHFSTIHSHEIFSLALQELLLVFSDGFKKSGLQNRPDILYCTTLTLSLKDQESTFRNGFKLLGTFPRFYGNNPPQVHGLTAYFFDSVLKDLRYSNFLLHPILNPFFQIVREQYDLPNLEVASITKIQELQNNLGRDPLPPLELIQAPRFVAKKFELTKNRRALSNQFYPFRSPNALATDANQTVEIFLQLAQPYRFASIIGEKIDLRIHPAELYKNLALLIKELNISYIELVIDAADLLGIQCILEAGFKPCAYFPAFKRCGHLRRDFGVFALSFDKDYVPTEEERTRLNPIYFRFL